MANAKKCDRCGEFYILASEKIPDSNETFTYSNVIQDSVLEISYYPDKPKEKYDLCKKCTNMLINFLKEKRRIQFMKNKGIKKTFGILIAITLAAGMMTGCGEKKIEKMEQKTSVHEQKKTVKNLKEDDLKNIITGLKDHYILQNAKNIDYLHGLNYDNKIIKKVTSESKDVKLDQVGTYIINYKITVNMTAYEKYQASQKEDKTNKIEQDSKELQTINVKKKIDVVDEKKAQELADNGTVVWKDNNDTVAKSDGTEVTEEIKEPDSVEDSKDKKNEGSKSSSDKKQDNRKKDDTQQTKKTDGTTNNTQSTSKPSQSNSGNSGNTSSQPASKPSQSNTGNAGNTASQPAKPVHTHTWVTQPATGHYITKTIKEAYDEPIYVTGYIFPDGYTCLTPDEAVDHSVDSGLGYRTGQVQNGTKHHNAETQQVWVQDSAAYQYCSGCGARK